MNTQQQTNNKLICQAIKKDGNPCKYKAKCGSLYCGVHKNYVDTSKPLFTEDEPEGEFTIKFKSMDNINHSLLMDSTWDTSDVVYDLQDEASLDEAFKYSIFLEGNEEELDDTHKYNPKNNYFLMKGENKEFKKKLEAFKNNEKVKTAVNQFIYWEFDDFERAYYEIHDDDTFSDEEDGGYEIHKNRIHIFEDFKDFLGDEYYDCDSLIKKMISRLPDPERNTNVKKFIEIIETLDWEDKDEFYNEFMIENFIKNNEFNQEYYERFTN